MLLWLDAQITVIVSIIKDAHTKQFPFKNIKITSVSCIHYHTYMTYCCEFTMVHFLDLHLWSLQFEINLQNKFVVSIIQMEHVIDQNVW